MYVDKAEGVICDWLKIQLPLQMYFFFQADIWLILMH